MYMYSTDLYYAVTPLLTLLWAAVMSVLGPSVPLTTPGEWALFLGLIGLGVVPLLFVHDAAVRRARAGRAARRATAPTRSGSDAV
jgi:hypothetical protein